jgi:hypothetical protein
MKTKISAVFISIVFSVIALHAQSQLTGQLIQKKSIEATRVAGVEAVATMTIIDSKGRQRVRKLAQISKFFDYREKDDAKWLYMPALGKTRRIVSSENAKSFMGSEFSYADMTPPAVEDFTYNILCEEEINGILCWKIEITPKADDIADENGFSKKISYIGKQDYVIRKAEYFDLDEELHKEFTVYEIKELDTQNHKYRLTHMVMENKQNGRQSIMKVEKIQFTPKVKDEYFFIRYLERE